MDSSSGKYSKCRFVVIADSFSRDLLRKYLESQGLLVIALDSGTPWTEIIKKVKLHHATSLVTVNCSHINSAPKNELNDIQWLNLHFGKLPDYKGKMPVQRAILNGEMEIGITLHTIDMAKSCIGIVDVATTPIFREDTAASLYSRCSEIAERMIKKHSYSLINCAILESQRIAFESRNWSEGIPLPDRINWEKTAHNIYNLIRAFNLPAYGAKSSLRGAGITIWSSEIASPFNPEVSPGMILDIGEDMHLEVATGSGILRLLDFAFDEDIKPSPGDCFSSDKDYFSPFNERIPVCAN
ncbi:MAG: hypothetical protein GF315_14490 [candidate division Zixibacteria bacterium]|nr:hypothetical protein [candidate division Zixibacteria bacterium]